MNNGESIIINVPVLTEERRKELSKIAKAAAEHAKVSVRNARKEANNEIKKLEISDDEKKIAEEELNTNIQTPKKKSNKKRKKVSKSKKGKRLRTKASRKMSPIKMSDKVELVSGM